MLEFASEILPDLHIERAISDPMKYTTAFIYLESGQKGTKTYLSLFRELGFILIYFILYLNYYFSVF